MGKKTRHWTVPNRNSLYLYGMACIPLKFFQHMKKIIFLLITGASWLFALQASAQASLDFDGSNDFVNCANNTSVQLSTGTIEAWIKTTNAGGSYRGIVVKQHAYNLFLKDNLLATYDWTNNTEHVSSSNLADNAWHHVALTFAPGTNNAKMYVDGVLVKTFTLAVNHQNIALVIGAGGDEISQVSAGNIDEVRVWNVVRSQTELQTFANCELLGSETGLQAYYKFNQS